MMDYFRKFDDLGVICTQSLVCDGYAYPESMMRTGILPARRETGIWVIPGQEKAVLFHTEQMSDYGISEVSVDYGEDSIFDVKKVQNHLCQECLDKAGGKHGGIL